MLVIRLFRVGKKNQPSFKIVVTEKSRSARKGRFVEEVGFYNPQTKEKVLKSERIKYWLSKGVQPSATVQNLLISEKIIEGKKMPIYMKKVKKETEAKPAEKKPLEDKPKEEKPVEEAKPVEEKPKEEKKPIPEKPVVKEPVPEKPAEDKPTEEKLKEETPKEEKEKQKEAPKTET